MKFVFEKFLTTSLIYKVVNISSHFLRGRKNQVTKKKKNELNILISSYNSDEFINGYKRMLLLKKPRN